MHCLTRKTARCACVAGWVLVLPAALAFDPSNGVWTKDDPAHIRIMTYNVYDGIGIGVDTTPATSNSFGLQHQYDYLGRICSAMDPDVICLQEVEPSADLGDTIDVVQGWADTYFGAGVFCVYVSTTTDNYNRNVILSRYPFADLNGDGEATGHDIYVFPGPGGLPPGTPVGGHLRGWAQAEIDLPDEVYLGDLYVGNSHLKCCPEGMAERLEAAQNTAYYINEVLNRVTDPLYQGTLDPLEPDTPVVLCGDFNEDEDHNGRYGPVAWLAGWTEDPNDGTDRDETEARLDTAVEPFSGDRRTYRDSTSKLDYILVQDSIATVATEFVFQSDEAYDEGALPPQLEGLYWSYMASSLASDHYPVIVDLILPLVKAGDFNGDGEVDVDDFTLFAPCLLGPTEEATGDCVDKDLDGDGFVDLNDFRMFQKFFGS